MYLRSKFSGGQDFSGKFCDQSFLEDRIFLVNFLIHFSGGLDFSGEVCDMVFWRNGFLWWIL